MEFIEETHSHRKRAAIVNSTKPWSGVKFVQHNIIITLRMGTKSIIFNVKSIITIILSQLAPIMDNKHLDLCLPMLIITVMDLKNEVQTMVDTINIKWIWIITYQVFLKMNALKSSLEVGVVSFRIVLNTSSLISLYPMFLTWTWHKDWIQILQSQPKCHRVRKGRHKCYKVATQDCKILEFKPQILIYNKPRTVTTKHSVSSTHIEMGLERHKHNDSLSQMRGVNHAISNLCK